SGASVLGHTSHASMGVDAADVNDDGRPDLVVLDMLPDDEKILKTSANAESFDVYLEKLAAGYHPQYAHNTLQLNRGVMAGAVRFSEIGYLAGVSATDWSWAPLLADLDNDGYKDLFITTGIYHRPNDLDYFTYVTAPAAIYRNRARELTGNHYLQVVLRGSGANTGGIGAKVIIKHAGTEQMLEQVPTRGFESSVDPRLHFGLGSATRMDSLIVVWPD